ncbi:MAG: CBS domain-containing protein [Burkholderiales bacterium]|nr:CBS domain-containing protein [Burkholderiales bacterium]
MTNRSIAYIVKDQNPVTLQSDDTVQHACQRMWKRRVGAALVIDAKGALCGIFTGRDAVRALGEAKDPAHTRLSDAMTPKPRTIEPERTAIDALRLMSDCGFRHLPVVKDSKIVGIVSRGDFKGMELDRLEDETALWERIA